MSAAGTLKRLAAAVFGGAGDSPIPQGLASLPSLITAQKTIAQIRKVMDERSRLFALRDQELEKLDSLGRRASELDAARVEALTEHRVSADSAAGEKAGGLLKQVAEIRQEMNDADAVAARLDKRAKELDIEIEPLKRMYQGDLGLFLCEVYGRLSEHYEKHAREAGEAVVTIAALHRVMMRYQTGNSNGWDGSLQLPSIVPGQGNTIPPLFAAGSSNFSRAASERMEEIIEQMRAAGFIWKFD
ncbi:MAG: hypothetical protein HYY78_12265 [Betaproteobacteria bacterium]|nr:hypothetical protein [Betaproteobacteria bacterium]